MKWIFLAIGLAAILPLSGWLRANPHEAPKVWIVVGLSPFLVTAYNLDVSVIDWAGWAGIAQGLQITLIDIIALAILVSQRTARESLPFKFVMGLYFAAVVLSVFRAQVPMAATFYVWQLARMFLVYVIVARASVDERIAVAILTGLAIGLCYEATVSIWQRFGLGLLRTAGSFGHQNSLGLVSHFAVFPLFALLLAGERGWQTIAAPLAGIVVAVLTTSRATLGLIGIGLVLVFVLSMMRGWTSRKASVLFVGLIVVALAAPIALSSFQQRFATDPISSEYDERAAFENTASMILKDHPFGAGANNYVVIANSGGYLARAGVSWAGGSRGTMVHNTYWLAAAETGYLGAFALMLLFARVIWAAFRCGWRARRDPRGDLLIGLAVSLLMVAAHSKYEWVFFYGYVQYPFAIAAGLVAGISARLGYWSKAGARQAQIAAEPAVRVQRR